MICRCNEDAFWSYSKRRLLRRGPSIPFRLSKAAACRIMKPNNASFDNRLLQSQLRKGAVLMLGMDLGIDLGTSQVVIYATGRGVVLKEPSVLAVDEKSGKLIACGKDAYYMQGRNPDSIEVVRPLRKGVIADYEYAEMMLREFGGKVCAYKVLKPRAAVSVPASVTEVEQRSVLEAVSAANVRRVMLVEESVAAAVGAGLDVAAPRGCMAADLGAGTADVAVMSLKGIAASVSAKVGGDDMDEAIVRHIRSKYNHVIGLLTAEKVKKTLGRAILGEDGATMRVPGRDAVTGLPRTREITAKDVYEAIEEPLSEIVSVMQRVLENTPPELAGDVMAGGIVLSGGLSQLSGMAELIGQRTGVECRVADNPENCVAAGLWEAIKYMSDSGGTGAGVYDISRFAYRMSDAVR